MAATVAALELAALVAIGVVALAPTVEDAVRTRELQPVTPRPPKASAAREAPILDRAATSVVVLNGSGVSGAAADTATRVRGLTYVVTAVGNAPRADYGKTVVMYRGDRRREAERLAKDLGVKLVSPLDGLRASELMGAHLALVLGS